MKPISPQEVVDQKAGQIPDTVIAAFNFMIGERWNGSSATFTQDEVVARITGTSELSRRVIFAKHYLDVEPIYRKEGWEVVYDKPGYNETYAANFTFRKPRG